VALVLLAAGLLLRRADGAVTNGGGAPGSPDSPRVVLIGVPGLSWQTVLDSVREGRLPVLARLAEGASAKGDLIATGYGSDTEILASVVTGRLAFKHGVHDAGRITLFETNPDPLRTTVWEWIASRGGRATSIGFPVGSTETVTVAAVRKGRAPTELLARVVETSEPTDGIRTGLQRCLSADLATATRAAELLRSDPDRHLFIYLDGLHCWEHRYGVSDTALRGYYEAIDGILGELISAAADDVTWMLFSERGNRAGPIDYRPRFPQLDAWPPIGFFMAWGRGVRRSIHPLTVAPVDLAPTLAYLSGHPVPDDMDGVVLFDLLDEGHYFRQRLTFRPQRPTARSRK
jgi:hypothetical protein